VSAFTAAGSIFALNAYPETFPSAFLTRTLRNVPVGFPASSDSTDPARSGSTGFSLCGLSCGQAPVHRLKPVLLKITIHRTAILCGKLTAQRRSIPHP
jgi:hypothetical protein